MTIDGDGPFAGGKFVVELNFDEYPFKPPKIKFLTKIWHPNVADDGQICTQAIDNNWVPTKSSCDVIDFVLTTFRGPSDENAQNTEAATQWKNDNKGWLAKAAQWTKSYAQ